MNDSWFDRHELALGVLALVALIVVAMIVINGRATECHAKGGEISWIGGPASICVSSDGRVIR